jgi:transcriptional regulator with XRE-family HTH domain
MTIGEQIKAWRESAGLSQRELAERLGVRRSAVGNYEAGLRNVSRRQLVKIAAACGIADDAMVRALALPRLEVGLMDTAMQGLVEVAKARELYVDRMRAAAAELAMTGVHESPDMALRHVAPALDPSKGVDHREFEDSKRAAATIVRCERAIRLRALVRAALDAADAADSATIRLCRPS